MNAVLALIIANIIWGAAAPIFKYSLSNIPPFTLAFARFFFAAILFLPFIMHFKFNTLTKRDWFDICLGGLLGISINISFFFLGLERTDSINAPVIASAGPLFLFLSSIFFFKEKLRYNTLIGMFVSLLGVLVIIFSPFLLEGKTLQSNAEFEGNMYLILATIGAVWATLVLKRVLDKHGPYPIIFISFLFSSFTFLPFMFGELQTWSVSQLNTAGIVGIVFGAVFSSAIAYYYHFYGMKRISLQELGVFTYIDPVVAVIIAIPLLHEYPTLYFFIGSLLVFLGIFISEKRIQYHPFHRIKK